MFHILRDHMSIGWDIDETLINGPNSRKFQQFVVNNPQISHNLVTFRNDKEDIDNIANDLMSMDIGFHIGLFDELRTVPLSIVEKYNEVHAHFKTKKEYTSKKAIRILEYHKTTQEEVEKIIKDMHEWKSLACLEIGSTILVDDIYDDQKDHCDRNGIIILDSLAKNGSIKGVA